MFASPSPLAPRGDGNDGGAQASFLFVRPGLRRRPTEASGASQGAQKHRELKECKLQAIHN
eukprot:3211182-Pyramimonas_sp.AAC.1